MRLPLVLPKSSAKLSCGAGERCAMPPRPRPFPDAMRATSWSGSSKVPKLSPKSSSCGGKLPVRLPPRRDGGPLTGSLKLIRRPVCRAGGRGAGAAGRGSPSSSASSPSSASKPKPPPDGSPRGGGGRGARTVARAGAGGGRPPADEPPPPPRSSASSGSSPMRDISGSVYCPAGRLGGGGARETGSGAGVGLPG